MERPRRIHRAGSELILEVEDILTCKTEMLQATRVNKFADKYLDVTETLKATFEHNNYPHNETIIKILDLRYNSQSMQHEGQYKWRGFSHESPTWEPIGTLHEDIPEFLNRFLSNFRTNILSCWYAHRFSTEPLLRRGSLGNDQVGHVTRTVML